MDELKKHADLINDQMARYGVQFGLYKDGHFQERLFPFDPIPRIIGKEEFAVLEKGLAQRVAALNAFLGDVYGKKQIIKDGVVPEEFVFRSPGYLAPCEGFLPPEGIYSHISGIDLVLGKDGTWYVLEDNLRIPSGASTRSLRAGSAGNVRPIRSGRIMWWITGITGRFFGRPWTM